MNPYGGMRREEQDLEHALREYFPRYRGALGERMPNLLSYKILIVAWVQTAAWAHYT